MLEFQLFRIKVFPQYRDLFAQNATSPEPTRLEILRETITSLPHAEFQEGVTWHLGNVSAIDDTGLYFRLGRTSTSTLEIFNEDEGTFVDQEFETAPYTHAVVDVDLGVCAIAKKTRLSPTTTGIARQFERLLNRSRRAIELLATFKIDDVKDPNDFISQLRHAHSISKFWVTFTKPNPFDADRDFVQPAQRMLNAFNGDKGKTEVKGKTLDAEKLEAVARSAAATGDNAGASLKPSERATLVKKQLKGSAVNVSQEDVAEEEEKLGLIRLVRDCYRRIRGSVPE